eukprot:3964961-Amphidinium_carterae.1
MTAHQACTFRVGHYCQQKASLEPHETAAQKNEQHVMVMPLDCGLNCTAFPPKFTLQRCPKAWGARLLHPSSNPAAHSMCKVP